MAAYHTTLTDQEENKSRVLLLGIELYVALDKLVMKEIPMLADYLPEIPIISPMMGSKDLPGRRPAEFAKSMSPVLPLPAKVVVFELQCSLSIRIWRFVTPRILDCVGPRILNDFLFHSRKRLSILTDVRDLQPYLVEDQGPSFHVQIIRRKLRDH